MERRRLVIVLAALTGALALVVIAAIFLGSARLSPADVLAVLTGRADASRTESVVIWACGCRASRRPFWPAARWPWPAPASRG